MRTGIAAQGYFVVRTANNTGHMSEFLFGAIFYYELPRPIKVMLLILVSICADLLCSVAGVCLDTQWWLFGCVQLSV